MKRKLAIILTMLFTVQLLTTSVFAADTQNNVSTEIQAELASAEEILGGPCKLVSQETEVVGNFIVENRFYALEESTTRSGSGKTGGVSSHVWRDLFGSSWNFKILLAGFFYYNGTTAICIPEETDIWAVDANREEIDLSMETKFTHDDGTLAEIKCKYVIFDGSQPLSGATISVTCSATGDVGYVSEEEHIY